MAISKHHCYEALILGTGAGATHVYSGEASSSFVVLEDGQPALLCDLGLGVACAYSKHIGKHVPLPPAVYVSHNHTDHAGELAVVCAVEASKGRCLQVIAHPEVMCRLTEHRMHELLSTGKPLTAFATFLEAPAGSLTNVPGTRLAIKPLKTQHSELCYGAVIYADGRPLIAWTADSGFDEGVFTSLADELPALLLLDARAGASTEHAGFEEVSCFLAKRPELQAAGCCVLITGYGRQDEAPSFPEQVQPALVARPGQRVVLRKAGRSEGSLSNVQEKELVGAAAVTG